MIILVQYCVALIPYDLRYVDPYNQSKCSINMNTFEGQNFRKCSTSTMLPKNKYV